MIALQRKKLAAWADAQDKLLPVLCRTVVQHLPKQWVDLSNVVATNTVPDQLDIRVTLNNMLKKPHLEVGGTSVWICNSIKDGVSSMMMS